MKVVPDTNVLVSAFLTPGSTAERALRRMRAMDRIVASAALIREWREVLARPRFQRGARAALADDIIAALLGEVDVVVAAVVSVRDCRDPKDDKVLECALAAGADLIVSGDEDLLVLHPWRGIPILSPAAYLAA